ncbi:hypothetical protein DRO27_03820 [Candidatus Bathyarchaeota archaeon]|nr:MAG: hypothetical protein DRO27_03820 [Candidatus Bathyarchaeota archaeon]
MNFRIILFNMIAVGMALLLTGVMLVKDFHIIGAIALFAGGFSAGFSTLAAISFKYSAHYNPRVEEEK